VFVLRAEPSAIRRWLNIGVAGEFVFAIGHYEERGTRSEELDHLKNSNSKGAKIAKDEALNSQLSTLNSQLSTHKLLGVFTQGR
jgi:hypothetical protein